MHDCWLYVSCFEAFVGAVAETLAGGASLRRIGAGAISFVLMSTAAIIAKTRGGGGGGRMS